MPNVREILTISKLFPTWDMPWDEFHAANPLERYFPVESYDYYQYKHDVAAWVAPAAILEVGIWRGYGALCMLSAAPEARYVGYDLPLGSTLYHWHDANLAHARKLLTDYATEFRLEDTDAIAALPDERFDLAHIDGEHSFEAASHDLELAIPHARYILMDDTNLVDLGRAVERFVAAGRLREISRFMAHDRREQRFYEVVGGR
jgi:hypothetical protein